jgi:hypothetical protein
MAATVPVATLDLRRTTGRRLDALFRSSAPGPRPTGRGTGIAIVSATWLGRTLSALIRAVAWRGKEFSADGRRLHNVMTPFELRAIVAAVYDGPSRLDGRPSIILDYSRTSSLARLIRDELRQVAPGLYLGIVFVGGFRLPLRFTLRFDG